MKGSMIYGIKMVYSINWDPISIIVYQRKFMGYHGIITVGCESGMAEPTDGLKGATEVSSLSLSFSDYLSIYLSIFYVSI